MNVREGGNGGTSSIRKDYGISTQEDKAKAAALRDKLAREAAAKKAEQQKIASKQRQEEARAQADAARAKAAKAAEAEKAKAKAKTTSSSNTKSNTSKNTTTKTTTSKDTSKKTNTSTKTTSKTNTSKKPSTSTSKSSSSGVSGLPSLEDQLSSFLDSVPGVSNGYNRPDYIDVLNPELRSSADLAALFGLNYDKDAIAAIFNDAVAKEYATRYAQQGIAEGNYYDQLASLQNSSLDSIRQQQAQAIQAGANKGMQAANQLSAILGVSQAAAETATKLAQDRGLLAKEHGAAQSKAAQDSMSYYDQLGQFLGEMSKQIYSYDTQQQAAQLGYNQGINTDYAGVMAQDMAAQSARASSIAQGLANIFGSYTGTMGNVESANINAAANKYTADKNYQGQTYTANQNYNAGVYAANKSAQAAIQAARSAANSTSTATSSGSSVGALTPQLYNEIVNSNKLPEYLKNQMIEYFSNKK